VQPPRPPSSSFIAQNITKNIRRLEGALIKVSSYSALTSKGSTSPPPSACSTTC
jgi:chromosomal replication initiation ATPase DnaA